LQED